MTAPGAHPSESTQVNDNIVICGGGLAGLSAAYHLKRPCTVIEKNDYPGGLLKSVRYGDFCFDLAPHIFFTADDNLKRLFIDLVGEPQVVRHQADARVYVYGTLTRFPFQGSLHGLPPKIVLECLIGLIKARYFLNNSSPNNFREWVLATFGKGIARHFMFPYNTKLWGNTPEDLTTDWVEKKVINVSCIDALDGALRDRAYTKLPNRVFLYPLSNGILTLAQAFAAQVSDLRLNTTIAEVDLGNKTIVMSNGQLLRFRTAIWTLPLYLLPNLVKNVPDDVIAAVRALRYRRTVAVHIGVARNDLASWHWMYFPETRYPFYRVSFPGNMSSAMVPKGASSLIAEVAVPRNGDLDTEKIKQDVVKGLNDAGLLRKNEALFPLEAVVMDPAYVVYDHQRKRALETIFQFLRFHSIIPAGRFGEWAFFNMDHTILSGRRAAQEVEKMVE